MRHRAKGRQLSRTSAHRRALLRNMAASLFEHEGITTTVAKAKELRPYAERLVTLARRGEPHAIRQVETKIPNREIITKLFKTIGPRFASRPGGYIRILKLGHRVGDGAEMARIELLAEGTRLGGRVGGAGGGCPGALFFVSAGAKRKRGGLQRKTHIHSLPPKHPTGPKAKLQPRGYF